MDYENLYYLYKKTHHRRAARFARLSNVRDAAALLRFTTAALLEMVNRPIYTQFTIPKKKGGLRTVFAPSGDLNCVQQNLNRFLQAAYYCDKPNCAHGFVFSPAYEKEQYNIVSNALPHVAKNYVMNIDLKDYFPSISTARVKALFEGNEFCFSENMAIVFALLSTYQRRLPIGAPSSPVIANLITKPLDLALERYCAPRNISYTRYADDLTFSSDRFFDAEAIAAIKAMIVAHDFTVNEKKFRIQSAMRQQTVTGLVVNEKVNVDRKYIRKIRAMLHQSETEGVHVAATNHYGLKQKASNEEALAFVRRLGGMIDFVGMVRGRKDELYKKLKKQFIEIQEQ